MSSSGRNGSMDYYGHQNQQPITSPTWSTTTPPWDRRYLQQRPQMAALWNDLPMGNNAAQQQCEPPVVRTVGLVYGQSDNEYYYPEHCSQHQSRHQPHHHRIAQVTRPWLSQSIVGVDKTRHGTMFVKECHSHEEVADISSRFQIQLLQFYIVDQTTPWLAVLDIVADVPGTYGDIQLYQFRPYHSSRYYVKEPLQVYATIPKKLCRYAHRKECWMYIFQKYGTDFHTQLINDDLCITGSVNFITGLKSNTSMEVRRGELHIVGEIGDDFALHNDLSESSPLRNGLAKSVLPKTRSLSRDKESFRRLDLSKRQASTGLFMKSATPLKKKKPIDSMALLADIEKETASDVIGPTRNIKETMVISSDEEMEGTIKQRDQQMDSALEMPDSSVSLTQSSSGKDLPTSGKDTESPKIPEDEVVMGSPEKEFKPVEPQREVKPSHRPAKGRQVNKHYIDPARLTIREIPSSYIFLRFSRHTDVSKLCLGYRERMDDCKIRYRTIHHDDNRVCVSMHNKKDVLQLVKNLHAYEFKGGEVSLTLCDEELGEKFLESTEEWVEVEEIDDWD